MAVVLSLNGFAKNLRPLSVLSKNVLKYCNQEKPLSIEVEIDALDAFTSQLVQKKSDKWNIQKLKLENSKKKFTTAESAQFKRIDVLSASSKEINSLCVGALNDDNHPFVLDLMRQCVKYRKIPIQDVLLLQIIEVCAYMGETEIIDDVIDLCKESQPEWLLTNANFQHFVATAVWTRGNITKSLQMFEHLYETKPSLRRRLRLILENLIKNSVRNQSEVILFSIIRFSEKVKDKFNDFYLLTCVWQVCFLSDWYSDQQISLNMLENTPELCDKLTNRIPYVVSISLRNNKTDPVYGLLEILLRLEKKVDYTTVIIALLEYQFLQGNLGRCREIIKWCDDNAVELPQIHKNNLISLLLKDYRPQLKKKEQTSYDLKF